MLSKLNSDAHVDSRHNKMFGCTVKYQKWINLKDPRATYWACVYGLVNFRVFVTVLADQRLYLATLENPHSALVYGDHKGIRKRIMKRDFRALGLEFPDFAAFCRRKLFLCQRVYQLRYKFSLILCKVSNSNRKGRKWVLCHGPASHRLVYLDTFCHLSGNSRRNVSPSLQRSIFGYTALANVPIVSTAQSRSC